MQWTMRLRRAIPLHPAALAAAPLLVLVAAVAAWPPAGRQLAQAWSGLAGTSPGWLWLALAAFLATTASAALAWRAALRAAGARLGALDASARYGVGCLVNTFAPASAGDAVRIALVSQRLDAPDGLWTAGGAAAAVAALRGVVLSALVVAASLTGALPRWPVFALLGTAAATGAVAWALRRRFPAGRLRRFLDAFTALTRSPRDAARALAWTTASQSARVGAAAAVAASLTVPHPLLAALVIVPTLQLATMLPLLPGNFGVASGAVALALESRGVGVGHALAAGIAYHAAETVVGIAFGVAGTLLVVPVPPLARRLAVAAGAGALALGLGVTVVNLV